MRSKKEVEEKYEVLRASRLRKRREEFLSQTCRNCTFNERVNIKGKGRVRLCQNSEVLGKLRREVFVCEDNEIAKRCRKFECRNTKDEVEQDFEEILRTPTRCGDVYPKLALMIWFLQNRDRGTRLTRLSGGINSAWRSLVYVCLGRWL